MDTREKSSVAELPAERLEADIVELTRHLAAGTYELLVRVGELDCRGTWARWGALSCAAWSAGHEDPADIDARHHNERSVSWRTDPDGMVTTTIRQPPAHAAVLHALLDHHVRHQPAPAGATRASLRRQRADALMTLINNDGARSVNTEVVIHIRGNEPSRLADGTPLNDHALATLLPDAFISLLLHDLDGHPIDASPRRRHPTRRQRRVNDHAHPKCAHPGCTATEFLQHDHITPYTREGPTILTNLQKLCGPHNRAKERADGAQ